MYQQQNDSDYAIVQRILAGERYAYLELIERHKGRGMTLALRMLKNREEAEEALQDAFVRAFKALKKFEWKSGFATWFYRIVFNVCSSQLQKRGSEHLVSLDDEQTPVTLIIADENTPELQYEQAEFHAVVADEMDKLPVAYSAILTMFVTQDMSYEEIMSVTGLPLGTIKNRLFRARAMLKEAITRRLHSTIAS